jgi:hypothetical protein
LLLLLLPLQDLYRQLAALPALHLLLAAAQATVEVGQHQTHLLLFWLLLMLQLLGRPCCLLLLLLVLLLLLLALSLLMSQKVQRW